MGTSAVKLTSDWNIDWAAPSLCDRYGVCVRYNLMWFLCLSAAGVCERVVGSKFAFLASPERAEAHHCSYLRINLHLRVHGWQSGSVRVFCFGDATRESCGFVRKAVVVRARPVCGRSDKPSEV
jgi:hypothetical protein